MLSDAMLSDLTSTLLWCAALVLIVALGGTLGRAVLATVLTLIRLLPEIVRPAVLGVVVTMVPILAMFLIPTDWDSMPLLLQQLRYLMLLAMPLLGAYVAARGYVLGLDAVHLDSDDDSSVQDSPPKD